MAQLSPRPFGALVTRMFREHDTARRIFDLPERAFVLGDASLDCSVRFHGRQVAAPFGPAAGPHTQLAQNIVLSWLAGGRVIELKTVQANDRLTIPRPCIDVRTVGFNVEWSQELTLEESLEEYVKGSMLIQMLVASGKLGLTPGFDRFVMDMSVGYDYAGITSSRVRAFISGLRQAQPVIDRLRREVPPEWRTLADLPFDPCIAPSVTLSTFHGCPPDEIGRIVEFLLREVCAHTIVKLNPTLLGFETTRRLLHDELGYSNIGLLREPFESDLQWEEMCRLVDRLGPVAEDAGLGFGVKLTNTLVVENDGDYLPAGEPKKYMSGAPLHVLAMHLLDRFRRQFGTRFPVSFSAGIDPGNYPDAVALGLTPITVCTDLLRAGGYSRGQRYLRELTRRMKAVQAANVDEFVVRAYGLRTHDAAGSPAAAVEADVAGAALRNTEHYVMGLNTEVRYSHAQNSRPPRKTGGTLQLFDCLTCDKCVPVCPNDANFNLALSPGAIRRETVWLEGGAWRVRDDGSLAVTAAHQLANFGDLCNECGNCDVACPEDGGPYRTKPRFFGTAEAWGLAAPLDGFCLETSRTGDVMRARLSGEEYVTEFTAEAVRYAGRTFSLEFDEGDLAATLRGDAAGEVDLTPYYLMTALRQAVLSAPYTNFVNCPT